MTNDSKPLVATPVEFGHVSIVVRDLEKSIELYQNLLGIGPWAVVTIDEGHPVLPDGQPALADLVYKGKPVERFKFVTANAMAGSIRLELSQPVEGDQHYFDFLEEYGEGIHHIGTVKVADLDKTVADLADAGCPCIQSGRILSTGKFAYVDTTKALGMMLEVVEEPVGFTLPETSEFSDRPRR